MDLRILFNNRIVAAGCLMAATLGFSLFGSVILTPQFQQSLLEFHGDALGAFDSHPRARDHGDDAGDADPSRDVSRSNRRFCLGIGFLIVTIANFNTADVITTDSTFGTFVFPLFFGGLGFGMLFVPLSVAVLSSVHGPDTRRPRR